MSSPAERGPEPVPMAPGSHSLRSLRFRITLASTVVFALAIGAAAVLLVAAVRTSVEDQIRADSNQAINTVKSRIQAGVSPESVSLPVTVDFYVLDPRGNLVAGRPWNEETEPVIVRDSNGDVRVVMRGDDRPIVVYERVRTQIGTVTLVAASPLDEVSRSVDALAKALWLSIPALVVAVALLAWWLVGRALRPVYAMRTALAEINGASMDQRVPEPGTGDEVDQLAHTMNSMLERLEHAAERQRRFVSDASHELRSPVASIRATVEVAQRRGPDADWPDVARRVLADDERLERMVDELLELARLDETPEALPETTVDLDDVVLDEVGRFTDRATLLTDRVSAGRVRGSRSQLERVVRNLLDNAVRHAAFDGGGVARCRNGSPGRRHTDRPARGRRRRARHPRGRPGTGLRAVHTVAGRPRSRRRWGRPRPGDGAGDRRAARWHGRHRHERTPRRGPVRRRPPRGRDWRQ